MRLVRVKVQNVGVLGESSLELGPFTEGINVVTGPNECGKSSIVRALRVALFERHTFKGESVKALRPHGSKVAPRVEVELEFDGVRYVLDKQFLDKPFARLRRGDDPAPLKDDEADAKLLALLDAKEGGKKGSHIDDMGVWGLLWVAQDEFATKEPGDNLGDNVRTSLTFAIEQQVGAVMVGKQGVHLYNAIEAAYQQHWTPKQDRATGKYAEIDQRVKNLSAEVTELERKLQDTERQGREIAEQEDEITRLAEAEAAFQREVEESRVLLEGALQIEAAREEAERTLTAAEDDLKRAEAAVDGRRARLIGIGESEGGVRAFRATLDELRVRLDALRAEAARSSQRAEEARRDAEAHRRKMSLLGERIEQTRAREDLARLEDDLAAARRFEQELRTSREALRRLPDEDTFKKAEGLETRRALYVQQLSHSATRVAVTRRGKALELHPVTRRQTIDLGDLGSIVLEPPRSGFMAARQAWREADQALRTRLETLGVKSVTEARGMSEARRSLDHELSVRLAQLAQFAPKGLPALAGEAERAEAERSEAEREHTDGADLQRAITHAEQLLMGMTVTPEVVRKLV